jgi:hypothetical protein
MDDDRLLIAYLAGIFDGEGSISIRFRTDKGRRPTVRPWVSIKMAWLPTLDKFLGRFGGAIRRAHKKCETNKALFEWMLHGHEKRLNRSTQTGKQGSSRTCEKRRDFGARLLSLLRGPI